MSIIAKYPGICARTWRSYSAGTPLTRTDEGWSIDDDLRIPVDATINAQRGDGEDFTIGETFRYRDHGIITVVTCRSRYFREDGLSFGVGDESGYLHTALCRPATQEESETVFAREREWQMRTESNAAYQTLFDKAAGELVPPRRVRPEGERVRINGGHDIMGHGTEVLIEESEAHIWVIENNSADGHCWAASNIGTAGCPGEIGYRFESTPERLAWVRNYQARYEAQDVEQARKIRMSCF